MRKRFSRHRKQRGTPTWLGLRLALAGLVWAFVAGASSALAAPDGARGVLIKLRSAGPHAVHACAESLDRRGQPFRPATADGSDSLDRLHARLGVKRVRALFRRPDGRTLAAQSSALRERLQRARRARAPRAALAAELPDLSHVYRVELAPGIGAARAAALFAADPHVEYAQPDYEAQADLIPDDPFFFSSGSWGQPYADLWGLFRINVEPAWERALGLGVIVAVNDTGVDAAHPDLADNMWVNPGEDLNANGRADPNDLNGVDDDGNGFVDDVGGFDFANSHDDEGDGDFGGPFDVSDPDPFDDNGHGTHIAGTIAAVGENGIGVIGVAPRARVMAIKGLDEAGSGPVSDLAAGIVYAAQNGARVINNSWSCSTPCPSSPVVEDAVRLAHALGVVLVFSAGNKSSDVVPFSPQNMRETLAVASTDPDDRPSSFSSFGLLVDVGAPGGGFDRGPPQLSPRRAILSTRSSGSQTSIDGGGAYVVGDEYVRLSGTSMSAPHVAGLAALLFSRDASLTNEDVRNAIRLSAVDLGAAGHDRVFGAGRIDAAAALALDPVPELRSAILLPDRNSVFSQRDQRVEISGTAAGADLAEHALYVGFGHAPEVWQPLGALRSDPVLAGPLGSWEIGELDDGPWTLRLVVTTRSGGAIEEFRHLTLERNPPIQLSPPGTPAEQPALSGDLAVWESPAESPEGDGQDIVAFRLGDESPKRIAAGEGDQTQPEVSHGLVAWRHDPERSGEPSIRACHVDARGRCTQADVAPATLEQSGPSVSGQRIVWADARSGQTDVFVCSLRPHSRRCRERLIGGDPSEQFDARIEGNQLLWIDFRFGRGNLFTCTLDARSGACPPVQVQTGGFAHFSPALGPGLVAWREVFELYMCELDPVTGSCPRRLLAVTESQNLPSISGQRIVWQEESASGDLDLAFCEYDPVRKLCPKQRLSAHPAEQTAPHIDGDRVVWQDERDGEPAVMLLELPRLETGGDRSVFEAELLRLPVSAFDPLGGAMQLTATLADGADVASVGARFETTDDARGELRWTPAPGQAASYAFTFSARSEGRLETYETLRVAVLERNLPPVIELARVVFGRRGEPLALDACSSFDPEGEPLVFRWTSLGGAELGAGCRLELRSATRQPVRALELDASDGVRSSRRRILAVWLPPFARR